MAIRTADQIRVLLTIIAMIATAAVMGAMPTIWAAF